MNTNHMDVDGEHHEVNVGLLVLQQTQTMSAKQTRIVEQQEMLVLSQKEIQRDVQHLQLLSSPAQHSKRPKPQSKSLASYKPNTDDADDEGDGSSSEEDSVKEKLPTSFHVSPLCLYLPAVAHKIHSASFGIAFEAKAC